METLVQFAEKAALWHKEVACSENPDISFYQYEIYRSSQKLFKAAIKAAYPNLDTQDIYDIWVDCMDTVAYCADYVRFNPESPVYTTPR